MSAGTVCELAYYFALSYLCRSDHCMSSLLKEESASWVTTHPGCLIRHVRMAYLAVVASHTVNGVAAIHSDIIRNTIFKARGLQHPPSAPLATPFRVVDTCMITLHPSPEWLSPTARKMGAVCACQEVRTALFGCSVGAAHSKPLGPVAEEDGFPDTSWLSVHINIRCFESCVVADAWPCARRSLLTCGRTSSRTRPTG